MLVYIKKMFDRIFRFLFFDIRHAWILLYYIVIFWQFQLIERRNDNATRMITCAFDDKIPYINWFVIFYLLWFLYVGVTLTIMVFLDKSDFYKICFNIYIGMTICYIFYLLYPHGQNLRVELTGNETNIFDKMVHLIYSSDNTADTAPSIHVLNSMAVTFAITKSNYFKKHKGIIIGSNILNVLIILSTIFIRQHSIIDVIAALLLAFILQWVIYVPDWGKLLKRKMLKQKADI